MLILQNVIIKYMKYPGKQKWRLTSTFTDHLKDSRRAGIPGADYASLPYFGDKILSPEDGELSFWRDQHNGLWAVVTTPDKHRWDFGHCEGVIGLTKAGTSRKVEAGDPIAVVGHSGFTIPEGKRGTHVHVSFRTNSGPAGGGTYVDPHPILENLWGSDAVGIDKITELTNKIEDLSSQLAQKEAQIAQRQQEIVELTNTMYELKLGSEIDVQPDILTDQDILFIKTESMNQSKTIAQEVGGTYAKYIAPSTAIAAAVTLFVARQFGFSAEESVVFTTGLAQVINIAIIVAIRKLV